MNRMTLRAATAALACALCITICACASAFGQDGATLASPAVPPMPQQSALADNALSEAEATEISVDAYIYASPLVLMELHRQVMTNVEQPDFARSSAPLNQFVHLPTFPSGDLRTFVAPNFDTLYSTLWYDVAKEPLIISLPESSRHYVLFPMISAWTDVFASPGTRTSGPSAQTYALVGPHWKGELPKGIQMLRSPTAFGWLLGRTKASKETVAEVNRFQQGIRAIPLSAWGKAYTPPRGKIDPTINMGKTAVAQVREMSAAQFWTVFGKTWQENPPQPGDYPILQRMARLGINASSPIAFDKLPEQTRRALEAAAPLAHKRINDRFNRTDIMRDGWAILGYPVGNYGTAYLDRAMVAWFGIGANLPDDALYPKAIVDADGNPFDGRMKYSLTFPKGQLPPVNAFWSLTIYDAQMYQVPNPINRFAIGDRDKLKFNEDGSLTIYLQPQSPGADKESNWLPTPAEGKFNPFLRLYWPKDAVLDSKWTPPAIQRVK